MKRREIKKCILLLTAIFIMAGCGNTYEEENVQGEDSQQESIEIAAEDIKLEGETVSEIFFQDKAQIDNVIWNERGKYYVRITPPEGWYYRKEAFATSERATYYKEGWNKKKDGINSPSLLVNFGTYNCDRTLDEFLVEEAQKEERWAKEAIEDGEEVFVPSFSKEERFDSALGEVYCKIYTDHFYGELNMETGDFEEFESYCIKTVVAFDDRTPIVANFRGGEARTEEELETLLGCTPEEFCTQFFENMTVGEIQESDDED